jgi:type VI secretion system secreted protein VgrG
MADFSQKDRLMELSTPLGPDKLLLEQFHGNEGLSELFAFELTVLEPGIVPFKFEALMGQPITVKVLLIGAEKKYRFFNGICVRIADMGGVAGPSGPDTFRRYQLSMVPKLWLLTKKTNSRHFQSKSVPNILEEILKQEGITYQNKITGTYQKRDYVCQYRETNFAFISRLMEDEGIYYYFEHLESSHSMVLRDDSTTSSPLPFQPKIRFSHASGDMHKEACIKRWFKSQELRPGKIVLWDHHFGVAHKNQESIVSIEPTVAVGKVTHKLDAGGASSLELYDFPGTFAHRFDGIKNDGGEDAEQLSKIKPDGKRTAEIRQRQEAAQAFRITGSGEAGQMTPGYLFNLYDHGNGDGDYLIISVNHQASLAGAYGSSMAGGSTENYENSFQVCSKATRFLPARSTPKPLMSGTTTAVVVGPAGSEIFTDKHSRIRVQFHWDRLGKSNADSSCWVRVATPWAGTNWGMVHIPRVGHEVVIAFEEGDADRPIAVGSVYNSLETPPYKLPDNMTQFGFKSRSTPKGDKTNFNELRFEDKKGKEHVYFHAEKDFIRVVENNDIEVIGFKTLEDSKIKDTKVSKQDQAWEVFNDRFEQIGVASGKGSITTFIQKDLKTTLHKGDETHTLEKGSRIVKIFKDDKLTLDTGDQTEVITAGSRFVTIHKDDKLTLEKGDLTIEIKDGSRKVTIAKNDELILKTGNRKTTVQAGKMDSKAAMGISFVCGPSKIEMTPAGIKMEAPMIDIKGTATCTMKAPMVTVEGQGMATFKAGGMLTVQASGVTMVKGGVVMIN